VIDLVLHKELLKELLCRPEVLYIIGNAVVNAYLGGNAAPHQTQNKESRLA
jgi:hypothetical protein